MKLTTCMPTKRRDSPGNPAPVGRPGRPRQPRFLCWIGHCASALLAGATALAADAWPQFRGPQARGVDDSTPAPARWDLETKRNVLWRTAIPGLAHASPVVWGNRLYVATAVRPGDADLKIGLYGDIESIEDQAPHQWRLLALDRDAGTVVWDRLALERVPRVKRHPKASHCNSTPATDGRHLVALFGSEGLFCFDLEGKLRWQKDLGPMDAAYFAVPSAQWGFGSSPVIHEGKVIVQCDVLTNSFLAAFDLADGRELWRTRRTDVPTWSTPTVVEVGTATQILVNGWHHIGAYDFATGHEVWSLDGGGDIPVPTPVVANGLAYFTSAHGRFRPMRAIRLEARGNITPPEVAATNAAIAWVHPRQGNYMQTPIVVGAQLYACLDNGVVTCFDAKTGAIRYSERLPAGQGYTASPVSDGRHLYFTSEPGNVYLVPADAAFEVVSTNRLGEPCMASPALVRGTLYFRSRQHLTAVSAP